jgi:hypothetical protein
MRLTALEFCLNVTEPGRRRMLDPSGLKVMNPGADTVRSRYKRGGPLHSRDAGSREVDGRYQESAPVGEFDLDCLLPVPEQGTPRDDN